VLGVHLNVEFEADSALPGFHELGQLTSAVFSLAKALSFRSNLDGREGKCRVSGQAMSLGSDSGTADKGYRLEKVQTLHCDDVYCQTYFYITVY